MSLNIKKVMSLVKKNLDSEWGKINFEYLVEEKEALAAANISLASMDDDIKVIISAYPGGGAVFRVIFDLIDKTEEVLNLLNKFNCDNPFFNAFVGEEGYLELRHFFICYEENMFKSYPSEFMVRIAQLAENEYIQELTRYTHK